MKKLLGVYVFFLVVLWIYFGWFYELDTYADSRYAAYRHAYSFTQLTFPWIVLMSFIIMDWHKGILDRIENRFKKKWIQSFVFGVVFMTALQLIAFPLDGIGYTMAKAASISHQPIGDWLVEWCIQSALFIVVIAVLIAVFRSIVSKFPHKWWLVLWLTSLPIAFFIIYVQPIWIDPLFEDFTSLEAGSLKDSIVELAGEAGIEEDHIFQVNMSEKTRTFNAYVTGIGGQKRIVLWDTMLNGMSQNEVLFILAHEIAHYVKHHVYIGVAGYLLLSFVLLWSLARIYSFVYRNGKERLGLRERSDLRSVPILLLVVTLLMFATQPINLYVSRVMERAADRYAIEHTDDLQPALESYQALAKESKSDLSPYKWIVWLRYTHPPLGERIERIQSEMEQQERNN
ncbi:M48 family metallopeptidase [Pontibacillus sp. ALD_SL1]|uniref:M48 family metallopeptidase n=1 Tax=Pontibacillus sp. ALD_SL1 TaxID=2777185 RepID=UPI001A966C52|nr:M48 family metallopeptidase [Pontibacillus sp. ALD_SL1]QST00752.1 M48 family metallopeptidase [Pontibacillus sp. ALD_SL1]